MQTVPPPPISPPGWEGLFAWISTGTLLLVVFVAGKLYHQFRTMVKTVNKLRFRVHQLSNTIMLANPDAWTKAQVTTQKSDQDDEELHE